MEREHLVRGLEDRGPALLRLDAGMRGAAEDLEVVVGDALPRADDVAVGARALEDQRGVVVRRQAADDRRAERRADLLVGVGDERDGGSLAGLVKRGDGVQAGQQPGLHVGHAGTDGALAVGPIRPLRGRARLEDGVHVADEQEARPVARHPADDEVAELRSATASGSWRMRSTVGARARERIGSRSRRPGSRRRACTSRSRC